MHADLHMYGIYSILSMQEIWHAAYDLKLHVRFKQNIIMNQTKNLVYKFVHKNTVYELLFFGLTQANTALIHYNICKLGCLQLSLFTKKM